MGKKKRRNKGFDPVKESIELGQIGAASVGGVGITAHIGQHVPASGQATATNIMRGMDTIKILPVMKGAGSVFGSLRHLEKKTKKKY